MKYIYIYWVSTNQERAGIVVLISDKTDFGTKQDHFRNNVKIVSKYIKQKLTELQGEIDKFSIVEGVFYGLPLKVFGSSRQQSHEDKENVNKPVALGVLTTLCPPRSPHDHKWHLKTMVAS